MQRRSLKRSRCKALTSTMLNNRLTLLIGGGARERKNSKIVIFGSARRSAPAALLIFRLAVDLRTYNRQTLTTRSKILGCTPLGEVHAGILWSQGRPPPLTLTCRGPRRFLVPSQDGRAAKAVLARYFTGHTPAPLPGVLCS